MNTRALGFSLAAGLVFGFVARAEAAPPEFCYELYKPVCAVAGTSVSTYPNDCYAKRARATILHPGECASAVLAVCPEVQSAPVCATSMRTHAPKTYGNLCSAEKDLAVVTHDGHC